MSDAHEDSAAWIRELVAGNEAVVEQFWSHYGSALQRLAQSRMAPALQRRLGPEDIVQSVCRTFLRRAQGGEFHLEESEDLWRLLCAITLTKVRQHARFHYRQRRGIDREQPLPDDSDAGRPGLPNVAAIREPTPDEAVAFADQMQHFFDALDDEERRLVQSKLDGATHDQIAQELDCSERTVRRLLERVRQRWEQELVLALPGK
jgi:RNA polymerase sigma-70 factor (ECF subfamily)